MRGEGEHPSKNHDFLFRAFSGIPVHNRDVDYVQVGQFSFGLYVAEFKRPSTYPRCPTLRTRSTRRAKFCSPTIVGGRKRARDRVASPFQDCGCRIVFATLKSEMGKNVKHKGPNARAREREKGHKLGPKIIGATKPPNGLQPSYTGFSSKRFASKKAKKAAATAAAWALLANSDDRKGQRKQKFSY